MSETQKSEIGGVRLLSDVVMLTKTQYVQSPAGGIWLDPVKDYLQVMFKIHTARTVGQLPLREL